MSREEEEKKEKEERREGKEERSQAPGRGARGLVSLLSASAAPKDGFGSKRAERSGPWPACMQRSSPSAPTATFRLGLRRKPRFRAGACRRRDTFQISFQRVLLLEIPV